jgi:hypothetical protein
MFDVVSNVLQIRIFELVFSLWNRYALRDLGYRGQFFSSPGVCGHVLSRRSEVGDCITYSHATKVCSIHEHTSVMLKHTLRGHTLDISWAVVQRSQGK